MTWILRLVVLPFFPLIVAIDMRVICPSLGLSPTIGRSMRTCWQAWKDMLR